MNHTIKGILTAAVITSMLIMGATMVPIMQNSFAHKKSDFKGAERDPNTNINTNTNSADSSSSSNATAENTNNINNTATATQSQEQSACAVAVTCPEGTTTVTPPPCNPSTVGGQPAIRTDDTCRATILISAGKEAVAIFSDECKNIPGSTLHGNDDISVTCIFPSTPPT